MKDNNETKWYNDKRFKYGTYSTIISAVIIALLIVINLIVGLFDYKIDMTGENIFSLGETSKEVLAEVNTDVNIYTTFKTNIDDNILTRVNEVLSQYKQECNKIHVENTDLYLHPDFANRFTGVSGTIDVNSIIVEGNGRYKVISYDDYYNGNGKFSIEAVLTSAIQFVTMETQPTIYCVTGHSEVDITRFTSLTSQLELSNYAIKTIDLLSEDIPADCTVLMITPGEVDYSEAEAEKVKAYLANDGRAFCLMGGGISEFANLKSIITAYGVDVSDTFVYEGDESAYVDYPYVITPQQQEHDITEKTRNAGYRLLCYPNLAVKKTELSKKGLEIESVLTTTDKAYIKAEENKSANVEDGDEKGTFDIAVAITDKTYTDTEHSTKLYVTGSGYYMLDPSTDSMVNGANSIFVTEVMNWLNDTETPISISSKNLDNSTIVVDSATQSKIKIFSWGVIPGILFLIGFVVWFRRRNK
jgi:hypothetical protein